MKALTTLILFNIKKHCKMTYGWNKLNSSDDATQQL